MRAPRRSLDASPVCKHDPVQVGRGNHDGVTAVALRVRSDVRRRWRAWISVALLIGVGAGAAMALAQGARRTA